jgi:CRISPR-associated protein Cas5h
MEILCFKISGKLAHFRKYYANNTAFSFSIPPRTSLMGIVAAIMGWERDSYYDTLSSDNFNFGIRVLTPLKKSFHRLNLLSIKKLGDINKNWSSDFRGQGGRIQTPFEVVSGFNLVKNDVIYQVFVSPKNNGIETFEHIKKKFQSGEFVYNISLGVANFNARLGDVKIIDAGAFTEKKSNDYILIHSAIPSKHVDNIKFEQNELGSYNFVEEDMMPGDYIGNNNREVKKMNKLLFSTTTSPLRIKTKSSYFQLNLDNELINIQFMDS